MSVYSLMSSEESNEEAWGAAGWVQSNVERTKKAFCNATAVSDRLALLRTWARFCGGRIDLLPHKINLSSDEVSSLKMFGLSLTNDNTTIRLLDEDASNLASGLTEALQFDGRVRQNYVPASPDGVLLRLTQHANYRTEAQKAAVRALLTQPPGSGLMVSMPTGSGKSLLFQIAARFEREFASGACAVVITPTVALALDHQRTLSSLPGLEGSRAIVGDMSKDDTEKVINSFRRGEVPVLLLSPERALYKATIEHLIEAATQSSVEYGLDARLSHLFVDEAHIVESWGRSFRPDFQRLPAVLKKLRGVNPDLKAVLLSATLPVSSRRVLRRDWEQDGEWLEVDAHVPRYEHDLVVRHFSSEVERDAVLDYVVDRAPRPAIIYTTKVDHAKHVFERLKVERNYERIALFTGETKAQERALVVNGWAEDDYDIVVATSAFGMGVDKSGVRSVLHACLPEGPARWYQEIGRAARDGGQGLAVCLFTTGWRDSDERLAYRLSTSDWLGRDLAVARWQGLLAVAGKVNQTGKYPKIRMNLDAFREGMRPREGDWNRGWNMSLLTLMQRSGVIRILSVDTIDDQSEFVWHIEVLEPLLLSDDISEGVWNRIFSLREVEVKEVVEELDAYSELMRFPAEACLMRSVFELIEPNSYAPRCGRCPACRSDGISEPAIMHTSGLEKVWKCQHKSKTRLPAKVTLIEPLDPFFEIGLDSLLTRLAKAGIQQFVVPDHIAVRSASVLSKITKFVGLIITSGEWIGKTNLETIPTALLLPDAGATTARMLDQIDRFSRSTEATIVIVGKPDRQVRGRRLDQTVSTHAPYREVALEQFETIMESIP